MQHRGQVRNSRKHTMYKLVHTALRNAGNSLVIYLLLAAKMDRIGGYLGIAAALMGMEHLVLPTFRKC
ncbi:MAG TPA: hypothetical protein PLL57_11325 [Flavobacteriales bacterium]|nr:hypothetical protein [Flavobacteriales bacterium]